MNELDLAYFQQLADRFLDDADFIAEARRAVPALMAEVWHQKDEIERLRSVLAEIRDLSANEALREKIDEALGRDQ